MHALDIATGSHVTVRREIRLNDVSKFNIRILYMISFISTETSFKLDKLMGLCLLLHSDFYVI